MSPDNLIARRWTGLLLALGLGVFFSPALQAATGGCYSAPAGLVGWWPGDGNATDIAGGNNGALQSGATANGVGTVGPAFFFDGANDYVQIPDSAALRPTNLTVEAWVLFNSLDSTGNAAAGQQYIVFKQNTRSSYFEGYYLGKVRTPGGDLLTFICASAGAPAADQMAILQSTTVVSPGVWYHVAGVRGTNYTELYVNGQLQARTNAAFAQNYGSFPLYFGTSGQTYWDRKFSGLLDEVSLYNRALSSNEVAAVYAAGAAGKCKAPAIASQPESQAVVAGATAQFTATATGFGALNYQWSFNGAALAGASSPSLTVSNVQPANGGSYTVVVTNTLGAATSAVATLTVWLPPSVVSQPESRTNLFGTDATFTVAGSGIPDPAYQWHFNGAPIPGATGGTLLRTAVTFGDAGEYQVVLTNVAGSVTSAAATLTVVCPAVAISPAALPDTLLGASYSQSLTASGGSGPYTFVVTAGTLPAGLALSTTGLLNGTPTVISNNGFTVTATDTNGCPGSKLYSLAVTGAPPVISQQPQSRTNFAGTGASFSVAAAGTPSPSYQWQLNGVAIPGATGSAYLRSAVSLADAGSYRVVLLNAAGSLTSAVATLTVICPAVTVDPATLPNGQQGVFYSQTVSAAGGAGPYSFAVTAGTLPAGLSLSNTGSLSGTPSAAETNSFTVTATDTNGCSGNRPFSLAVVSMPPVITTQPENLVRDAGTTAQFSVSVTGSVPLSYQWREGGVSLTNNGRVMGATSEVLEIDGLLTNDAGEYSVIISNAAGVTTSDVATLVVTLPVTCVTPAAGLVGWWPGEGDVTDMAGTNNGTLQGGATAGAVGFVGSAFGMDGTNGYVRIPDSPALRPTNLTVEAWVRFSSLDTPTSGNSPVGEQYLVFKENTHPQAFEGYALTKERNAGQDVFNFAVSSAAGQTVEIASQTLIVTGVWYHVAAVRGPNYLQLYVNGQLESQANVSFPQDYGNYPLLFGTSGQPTWDHKFAGRLDEVSLYNRALTSNEVAAIYAAGTDGKCRAVTITSQPQSQTVGAGFNVAFSVTASGSAPLMYRWQRAGVDLMNGNGISGAFSRVLSLANVTTNDSASYRVVITNALGARTSAPAVLTVLPEFFRPAITTQPVSQTAAAGTNVTFSVGVSGTAPFSYQWWCNGSSLAPSAQYSGVDEATLTVSYVLPANSGGYSVVVSNAAGAVTSAVATLTVSVPNGCLPPPAGIVGWWPGDGSARDIVGTNDGTLVGTAVANAPGFTGQAFSMDGTNGYVRIPDSPAFHPTNLTVECWVRFAAYQTPGNTYYSNQQYIVFKQSSRSDEFEGFALTKDHDPQGDVFLWEVASASGELVRVDTVSTVVTGVWYHVVGVRGSNYVQLYKDGMLEVQTNVDFPQDYGNNPLYFGTSGQSYYDRRLHAELDEVALYNRALSAEEIATLYAAGAAGKCKGTNGVSITFQPQSQSVFPGTNVTFSVAAAGLAPLAFQWQWNGAAIVGATSASLTLTNVQTTNSGSYRVVVSNPAGAVVSDVAVLAVGIQPLLLNARETGDGMFSFMVSGPSGMPYVIEYSTNFLQWISLTTVTTFAGQANFTDPGPPSSAPRFYRARLSF